MADDIQRICAIWRDCRGRHGAEGEFLFGGFTIADTLLGLPAMRNWYEAARAEPRTVENYEL